MNTHRNPIAEQNLALAAPALPHGALRLALNLVLPVLPPVSYHYHTALQKDHRLP